MRDLGWGVFVGAVALGLVGAGCSDAGADDGRGEGPATLGTLSSEGESGGSGGGGDTTSGVDTAQGESGAATGSGPIFDVGDGGTGSEIGCQKVDFLFVIDNSPSMENEQAQLVAAFPGFMETVSSTLEAGSDYHIMVVDTDEWGRCDTVNGFQGQTPDHDSCNNYIETTPFQACDAELGAGVTHPAGAFASNMQCNPFGGARYIVEGEPDLPGTFACMATVGTAGHSLERPMDAMVAALAPAINAPGGCNAGFLRDDALLVITFISDDPRYEDAGDPMSWYQSVVNAKLGDPNAAVVLGVTPNFAGCGDDQETPKGAHWAEFIDLWGDAGLHGNVCSSAMEYVNFFQMAVDAIDVACDNYVPPG